MEIRTLRYFLAVAREENMSRAAEILHVTQPTLSKQLKSLEEELGKKLFTRHSFSIKLTDEGILLRNRAEDLVSMADKIEQEFVSLDDISGGDLYLGLAESYQLRFLARAIKTFKENYPNLHYHITSGDTEQLSEKVEKGLLDFVVLVEQPDTRKYEYIEFPQADTWGLIIPGMTHWQRRNLSVLMTLSSYHSSAPIRHGMGILRIGQEAGSPNYSWRVPSDFPIMAQSLPWKVWDICSPISTLLIHQKTAALYSDHCPPNLKTKYILHGTSIRHLLQLRKDFYHT